MTLRFLTVATLAAFALAWAAASASAAPTWLAPESLSTAGHDAYVPQVTIDAEGDAVAVWEGNEPGVAVIQAASREAGGAWSAPVDLSAAGEECLEPQVALDARGDAIAVWRRNDGAYGIIQAATRKAGGAWSAPVDLSAADQNGYAPRIALDAEGDAVVVWDRNEAGIGLIQAASKASGGVWSAPETLSTAGQRADEPEVAIDPRGDAVVVWKRFDGSNFIIQAASSLALGAWSIPVDLSATGQSASDPQVAIDPEGEAVAVWERYDGSNDTVQASSRSAGGWLAAVSLSTIGQDASAPEVAIDPGGDAMAVWQVDVGPSESAIEAASRPAGAGWSAGGKLSAVGARAEYPRVGLDAAGNATVLWQGWSGTEDVIQAARRAPGAGWAAPTNISTTGKPRLPQLAVAADGDAVAVWGHGGEAAEVVQAAFLDAAGPRLRGLGVPASGAVGQALSFSVSPFDAVSAMGATSWSFGDGTSAGGTAVTHAYDGPGTYTVTVTSVDAVGNTSVASSALAIAMPSPPPAPIASPAPTLARAAARARVKAGKALLKLTCPASGSCKGRVVLSVRKAKHGHGARKTARARSIKVGAASFTLAPGAHATVAVKLNAKGLDLLKASGRRGLKARLGGSGVKPGPLTLKATPRRRSRHHPSRRG